MTCKERLAEAERLLIDLRNSSTLDINMIEADCRDAGEEAMRAAAPGIAASRALLAAVDAFLEESS